MSRSPSIELITEATVAEYIHEISARHGRSDPESRRTGGRRSGPGEASVRRASRRLRLLEGGLRSLPSS